MESLPPMAATLQLLLGPVGAQQGSQGLAPAVGILPQLLEVLLEASGRQSFKSAPAATSLAHRLHDRQVGARGRGSSR